MTATLISAVEALRRGEIVAYPTETFYGLAVDAASVPAIERLLALKGRDAAKGLSVLVVGEAMLDSVVAEISPMARAVMSVFWPGAVTLALPARPTVAAPLVQEGCVAVRESPHPVARALVAAFGGPITATSANPAGAPPATRPQDVAAYFGAACLLLDGGSTPGGAPSTLARVRGNTVEVLRQGAIDLGSLTRSPPRAPR